MFVYIMSFFFVIVIQRLTMRRFINWAVTNFGYSMQKTSVQEITIQLFDF